MRSLFSVVKGMIKIPNWQLLVICLFVFCLQLCFISMELPTTRYSHDEINTVEISLRLGRGILPDTHLHGPITVIFLFILFGAYYIAGRLIGLFVNIDSFAVQYITHPEIFFTISKVGISLLGLFLIVMVYKLADKMYGKKAGLYSSFLMGSLYLLVFHSTLIKDDIMATLFVVIMHYFVFSYFKSSKNKDIFLASFFCGAAIAAKLNTSGSIISLYMFYLLHRIITDKGIKVSMKSILIGLGMSLFVGLGFLGANPFFILDSKTFFEAVGYLINEYTTFIENDYFFFWRWMVPLGLGRPFAFLVYIFFLISVLRRRFDVLYLLVFPLAFFLVIHKKGGTVYNILPVIPFFVIAGGVLLSNILSSRFKKRKILVFILIIAMLIPSISRSINTLSILNGKDTRTLAKSWIEDNVPSEKKIYIEGGVRDLIIMGPQLTPDEITLKEELDKIRRSHGSAYLLNLIIKKNLYSKRKSYRLFKEESEIDDADKIIDLSPDYIILSGVYDEPTQYIFMTSRKESLKKRKVELAKLDNDYEILKVFKPHPELSNFFPLLTVEDLIRIDKVSVLYRGQSNPGPEIKILVKK